jgi:hypothetical protein
MSELSFDLVGRLNPADGSAARHHFMFPMDPPFLAPAPMFSGLGAPYLAMRLQNICLQFLQGARLTSLGSVACEEKPLSAVLISSSVFSGPL